MKRHFVNSQDASSMSSDPEDRPRREASAPPADDTQAAPPAMAEGRGTDEPPSNQPFEELSISELLALFWRAPAATIRRYQRAVKSAETSERLIQVSAPRIASRVASAGVRTDRLAPRDWPQRLLQSEFPRLALYLTAFLFALAGSAIARGTTDFTRSGGNALQVAAPYLWLGFLLWLLADVSGHWRQIKAYWQRCERDARMLWWIRIVPVILVIGSLLRLAQSLSAPREAAVDMALSALFLLAAGLGALALINEAFGLRQRRASANSTGKQEEFARTKILDRQPMRRPIQQEISRWRMMLAALASALSLVVWANTSGNRIEPSIMLVWLASIAAWALVFAPLRWNLFNSCADAIDKARRFKLRGSRWAMLALAPVLLVSASFRFDRLDAAPPELISDMVVNIVDAYRIQQGESYPIFLGNNGGREPIHVYFQTFISSLPGMQFDRNALVLSTALESFLTLPVMFWFAVEVMGKQRRGYALAVGLLATALLAVSFWHVVLARQGLRIPLSPLFTALSALFFARALRHNRRSDFILAGITLSCGLYSYKSLRMLPLVYVICVAIALLLRRYTWRARLKYIYNLAVLAFVAGAVFLPMLHYWVEEPGQFTARATTRMFGDRPTSDAERLALLREGGATFLYNARNALLMFHHTHDNTWVSAIPGQPALDPVTGALLLLGAAAWLGLMASERDPVYWFVPALFFVMLLLTALAIAFPIEVPSLQRASGAIPSAYLIAALPLAILCRQFYLALPRALGLAVAVAFALAVIAAAYQYNRDLYFGDFMDNYHRSAQNHAEAGQVLRGFAESDGGYGNAFIISSPHWWDHRAVGVEAGAIRWDNSIVDINRLPQYISNGLRRNDQFQLQPERDLLFFFAPRNEAAPPLLRQWFPAGRQLEIKQEPAEKTFFIYRAPALGADGLQAFLAANN